MKNRHLEHWLFFGEMSIWHQQFCIIFIKIVFGLEFAWKRMYAYAQLLNTIFITANWLSKYVLTILLSYEPDVTLPGLVFSNK